MPTKGNPMEIKAVDPLRQVVYIILGLRFQELFLNIGFPLLKRDLSGFDYETRETKKEDKMPRKKCQTGSVAGTPPPGVMEKSCVRIGGFMSFFYGGGVGSVAGGCAADAVRGGSLRGVFFYHSLVC